MTTTAKSKLWDISGQEPPKTHNLAFIFQKSGLKASQEILNFLNLLTAHYIQNHYPEYKSRLSTVLDKNKARQYLKQTEEVYQWLNSLII